MRLLNNEESQKEIEKGAGVLSFRGGFGGTNGCEILVIKSGDYFFEKDEVGGEEYQKILNIQNQEAEEFLDTYRASRG